MAEQLNIADIKIGKRFRKDLGDIDALAASIQKRGALLQPIVITADHRLIGGMRRLTAVKKLGWTKVPVHVVKNIAEAVELLKAERDENTCRKPYTPTECVEIGDAIEQMLKPKMKQRQQEGGERGRAKQHGKLASSNLEEARNGKPAEAGLQAAAAVGMSHGSYYKAKTVARAAKEQPEKFKPIAEEMDETGNVDRAYRKVRGAKKPPAIRKPPSYPHSYQVHMWLEFVMGEAHVIDVEQGGIQKLLEQEDGWDWVEVERSIYPRFQRVIEHLGRYQEAIRAAINKRGKAVVP
jgi:ParB-like chromosome segregation protein Spo0J